MSLRSRLVLGMVVVAIVLIGTALTITRTTQSYLVGQVDDQLHAAGFRGRELGVGPGGLGGPGPAQPTGQGGGGPNGRSFSTFFVGYVSDDGSVVTVIAPNLGQDAVPDPKFARSDLVLPADQDERSFTVGSVGSSVRYRALVQRRMTAAGTGVVQVVALPLTSVESTLDRLRRVELGATFAVLALLALVTFWVLRLGVRPIKAMTATATAIAGGDLSHRVPDVKKGTEAGELGVALNSMLGRIEEAFDQRDQTEGRLRRFAADASHELRTPVTTIRGYAELYRTGALDQPERLADAMRRTEQEAIRMGRLIEDLLLLARLDQSRPLELGPVDLAAIARDAVADARAVQPDRPVTAVVTGPVVVAGEEGRLRQVVANLVSNALVHTDPGVPIEVRAGRDGAIAVLEVHDAGPGMDAEVAGQVFERFYRADPSRARNRGGTGLGLSISQSIVLAHGGHIGLRTAPGQGTTVRIELPDASTPGPT